ncbi:MAG: copper resistance CopC/CopD family protein [Nitriliruptorales bacterium]
MTLRRSIVCALLCAAALAAGASPAWAHTVLRETAPVDGEQLDAAPGSVAFVFNEPVSSPTGGGVRVFDTAGQRVDTGEGDVDDRSEAVAAELRAGLGDGTYIATYRITSADGHPVKGAIVFQVGEAGAADEALIAGLLGGGDGLWGAVAGLGRWLEYLAALAVAGAVAFLRFVHVGGDDAERARLRRLVVRAAVAGLVLAVVGVGLQAALATGLGATSLVDVGALTETLGSPFGLGAAVRVFGLALLTLAVLRGHEVGRAAMAGAGVVAVSFLLGGHTMSSDPRWLMLASDLVHVTAAAVWFGGLWLLALLLRARRPSGDPVSAAALVAGFSRVATLSLAAVSAAGLALAWIEVRALRALVSTPYGWTLSAKVVVVALIVVAAAYNHRRLVPTIAGYEIGPRELLRGAPPVQAGAAADDIDDRRGKREAAWGRLGRTVRFEAVGLAAVLLITAFLTYLQPAAEAAGITGIYSNYVDLGPEREINVVVDPNRAGVNEIHLFVLTRAGRPATDLGDDVTLRLSKPNEDIGPIERAPQAAGPGHFLHTGPELSIPGPWVIEIVIRVSDFEELRTQIPVTVNP